MPRVAQQEILKTPIQHIDVTRIDTRPIIGAYQNMRGSAGDLARGVNIVRSALEDRNCTFALTLAGSSSAQGLMHVWPTMVRNRMVDLVVATGASIIDMDFFEALGFRHYRGNPTMDNEELGKRGIDRIYDTLISERDLVEVDKTIEVLLNRLEPRAYAPWEIAREMGRFLADNPKRRKKEDSLVQVCFEEGVPIFSAGLTDSAFGMGSSYHQLRRTQQGGKTITIDTTRDYSDMAKIKLATHETGMLMIGGGVPKNHWQDTVIVAQGLLEVLRHEKKDALLNAMKYHPSKTRPNEIPLHKYAVQITVADPRDGACSSSTLQEARTWGKVDLESEQMVYGEATALVPLMVSALYHDQVGDAREPQRWADRLAEHPSPDDFLERCARR